MLESLEPRKLLAAGPQLIGIQPNSGDLITDGSVRSESPGELVFRFDENQVIDPATLDAIRIVRSGGDGTFDLPVASSDFGSVYRNPSTSVIELTGGVDIQLTQIASGQPIRVTVTRDDGLAAGAAPQFTVGASVAGTVPLTITLAPGTTAFNFIEAFNASASVNTFLNAQLKGGHRDAVLMADPAVNSLPSFDIVSTGDEQIVPTFLEVGAAPNQNEVIARFSNALPDDDYRIEVFGFDDPALGIVGLRSISATDPDTLLIPSQEGARKEVVDFRLDLGAQVQAVVPQPVVRLADGSLNQRRNEIVVYFNDDDLFVENLANGQPTDRSAENPRFYTLIFTQDSVSNRDDIEIAPSRVVYNPAADTATLVFDSDLSDLVGGDGGIGTFRLRVGTAEAIPLAPQRVELGSALAATDLNSGGAATLRFQSVVGAPANMQVRFVRSGTGAVSVAVAGSVVTVDLGAGTTFADIVNAINTDAAASLLLQASVDGAAGTAVGTTAAAFAPVSLLEPGDSFTAAADIGTFGIDPNAINFRSVVLSSAIDPINYQLELLGGNDDPGHRDLVEDLGDAFSQHVNDNFGADVTPGITTIPYNFRSDYGIDDNGTSRVNSISERQKERIREALDMWASELGVQFFETDNQGFTFATGDLSVLGNDPTTGVPLSGGNVFLQSTFGVRVDPAIATTGAGTNATLVMDSFVEWEDLYGEDYFRTAIAGIGFLLGLEQASDLPSSTLMNLDSNFLANDSTLEPVFPGNYDILHGQYVWRPESGDIDLYRFEIDLDDPNKLAVVTAETFAERLGNSSLLDTSLTLYKQQQASVVTDFGVYGNFEIDFTAVQPGDLGNRTGVQLVITPTGSNPTPTVEVTENQIVVYMSNPAGTTVQQVVDAINASPAAANLVTATLVLSEDIDPTEIPTFASLQEDAPRVLLTGGGIVSVARNDDYYSEDSFLEVELGSGVYYIGVMASGNDLPDPTIGGTGFGGTTQGEYELQLKFRPQVDETDVLRDLDGNDLTSNDPFRLPGTRVDASNDGTPGGVFNFWFQTRPLNRQLDFVGGGDSVVNGQVIEVTNYRGITRRFEFSNDGTVGSNRVMVAYNDSDTPEMLASKFAAVLGSVVASGGPFLTSVAVNGSVIEITGEQLLNVPDDFVSMDILGRTIFVDNFGSSTADGSAERPFDSISGIGIPNAFAATHPGDIVRIVGNGGLDQDPTTLNDNFAYEIGFGSLPGQVLQDGTEMEVPKGVTAMIDANAIFKLRRSYIGVGSSTLLVDRSGGALQVLGTPTLVDDNGAVLRDALGNAIEGSVYFTSALDRTIATPQAGLATTPGAGDWGGLLLRRDIDQIEGRTDLEDQGIFLQHIGFADIKYGGGANTVLDGNQKLVNPIQIVDMRPTIANNTISNSADAAISATPDSFKETNFQTIEYQLTGAFTADYDRVGPDIYQNQLTDNSINGMFIRATTPAGGTLRKLTVAGRFDDTDVVHVIAENLVVDGTPGGPRLYQSRLPVDLVDTAALSGGSLTAGVAYEYRIVSVDAFGNEGLPSDAIVAPVLGATEGRITLSGLPPAEDGFLFRRVYRLIPGGTGYDLVAILDANDPDFIDDGDRLNSVAVDLDVTRTEVRLARPDASLKIDPGSVIKVQGSRLEFEFGTQLLAEGLDGQEIIFTSILDDRYGAGGEFDTENGGLVDGVNPLPPSSGDWGGLYFAPGAHLSLDNAVVAFGGGLTRIEGTFRAFSAVELQQATARITNTSFEDNHEGLGGQGPRDRLGRLDNVAIDLRDAPSDDAGESFRALSGTTIFVRGSQPVIVGNTFIDNVGSTINIDGNSLTDEYIVDIGRDTGPIARIDDLDDNYGPLVRRNRMDNNGLNGLEIRGRDTIYVGGREFTSETAEYTVGNVVGGLVPDVDDVRNPSNVTSVNFTVQGDALTAGELAVSAVILTTRSIWDDTDIVHVPYQQFITGNLHSSSGLRLQSRPDESLVVKFAGSTTTSQGKDTGSGSSADPFYGTGLTATGSLGDIDDRVGGTLQIVGLPGSPVVLTALADDTVGASLKPDGTPQTDTNNDQWATRPEPNDWRGIYLDEFSNDRNVEIVLEREAHDAPAPGLNADTVNPEVIGDLAATQYDSDDTLRLGFEVSGFLTENDIDVYAFSAVAGTEVWIDVDRTSFNLDSIVEVLDSEGRLLARSTNSTDEVFENFELRDEQLGTLQTGADELNNFNEYGLLDEYGTTNPRDAGFRISLPGVRGARDTYYVRIRSQSVDPNDFAGGITSGKYEFQIRMQEEQEFSGSTVRYADIRYAKHGVHAKGLPYHSPLLGEAQEDEGPGSTISNNNLFTNPATPEDRAQYVGNLLNSDLTVLSVGGELSSLTDVDFYQFDIVKPEGNSGTHFPTIFDVDYADDLGRPDTTLWVYYDSDGQSGSLPPRLVYTGADSNIAEDRSDSLNSDPALDFDRGSVGSGDPFIGSVELPEGTYFVAITESSRVPSILTTDPLIRREPIASIKRLVDDQIEALSLSTTNPPTVLQFIDQSNLPAGWQVTTNRATEAGHGVYSTFDGARDGVDPVLAEQAESEPNDGLFSADSIDGAANWGLNYNSDITQDIFDTNTSTNIPHTTIQGVLDDSVDFFRFTVPDTNNGAGNRVILDIDNGFDFSNALGSDDFTLELFAISGPNADLTAPILTSIDNGFDTGSSAFGGFNDPMIDATIAPGTYVLAVVEDGSTFNATSTTYTSPDTLIENGNYTLHVSVEGHAVGALGGSVLNESLHFDPSTGNGTLTANQFDLSGYTADDQAFLYFNYALDTDPGDVVTVHITSNDDPVGQTVASSDITFGGNILTSDNIWRQARIPLKAFAGDSGVTVEFQYSTPGGSTSEGFYIDDFIVGFAEHGELITGSSFVTSSSVDFVQQGTPGTFVSGAYQLEVRPGTDYADTVGTSLEIREVFDTNDRQSESITVIAPAGFQLADGDFFELSDGFVTQEFEFNSTGGVKLGRVAIPFQATDSASTIAAAMISAINSPAVAAKASFSAASSGGITQGSTQGDARINLFGNVRGDFAELSDETLGVTSNADSEALAGQLLGNGLTLVSGSTLLTGNAGTFDGGSRVIGIEQGVVLTTGDLSTVQAFNLSDSSTGSATGLGDVDLNEPGVLPAGSTSVDSTALEFQFTFDDSSTPGSLFLELAFASEEFFEASATPDVAAIFLSYTDNSDPLNPVDITIPVPISGQDTIGTGNLPVAEVINNDPNLAGKHLSELGFDGISRPLTASLAGLDPSWVYTVKIVVADVANTLNPVDSNDSAVFVRASSISTEDSGDPNMIAVDQRVTLPAIVHLGVGDTNAKRQQGQLLIHSNTISDSQVYGVWIEGADREQDPEDFRANGSPTGFGSGLPHGDLGQPYLGRSYGGAVRNLRALNNSVEGGLVPGAVVVNNVIDQAGVSGITVEGTTLPWIINTNGNFGIGEDTTLATAATNTPGSPEVHFGDAIRDGAQMIISAAGIDVLFEFEDISGDVTGDGGSGVRGGNGVSTGAVPIYYRMDAGGTTYNPQGTAPNRSFGYTEHEMIAAIYDAIIGSVLVTNDLVSLVTPTIGPSVIENSITSNIGNGADDMAFVNPALYLDGVTNIRFPLIPQSPSAWLTAREVTLAESPQPFVRIVNNTIYGSDGNLASAAGSGTDEPNDTIAGAVVTHQGSAVTPFSFTTSGVIGDSPSLSATQDVDIYQIELDAGDRVQVDIDSLGLGTIANPVDTTLWLFDSAGRPASLGSGLAVQTDFSQSGQAPGEAVSEDPYLDFTATHKGTYYVAVSAAGNESYDPLSLAGRSNGIGQGNYQLEINVSAPREFILALADLNAGDTIEITDVAGNVDTFTVPNDDRPWDQARNLATTINNTAGNTLPNHENGNGPDGLNGPVSRVEAIALGGISGDQPGINEILLRFHHALGTAIDSQDGFGHDRLASTGSTGDGTSEQFVVIDNAATISINGVRVTNASLSTNQSRFLPETGIMVRGASPTILNNIIMNTRDGVVDETTSVQGQNPARKDEVIVGNNIFQGIRGVASNVNPGDVFNDFNDVIVTSQQVLNNPEGDNFIPNPGSYAIDSSIESLLERDKFAALKSALGISPSPVLAPSRDVLGLLRADDPSVATPGGIGGNVFIDRGAVDRADFVGPGASLILPFDNDGAGTDRDSNLTRVDLNSPPPSEFRIRLQDVADPADPFVGSNIDNDTVINSALADLRKPGAVVTLFENGDLLEEGVDYTFRYDTTTETVILNPLAGAWKPDAVYQIGVNNRDRFVLVAPPGTQAVDGSQFVVTDNRGGTVTFEYETGYQLQLPTDINLQIPLAGGGAGGVRDGDRIRITSPDGLTVTTFEFDRDGTTLTGNIPVPFVLTDTQADIVNSLNAVLVERTRFPVDAVENVGNGLILLTPKQDEVVDVVFEPTVAALQVTNSAANSQIQVDPLRQVADGDLIRITSGTQTFTFEIDLAGTAAVDPNNLRIPIRNASNAQLVAQDIQTEINKITSNQFPFETAATPVNGLLTLVPKPARTATVSSLPVARISSSVVDGDVQLQVLSTTAVYDGDLLRVSSGTDSVVFEVDTDGTVADGNVAMTFVSTINQQQIANGITAALRSRLFSIAAVETSLSDTSIEPGTLFLAAQSGTVVDTGFSAIGQPVGSLALSISELGFGIGGVADGQTFTINDGGISVTFELDNDGNTAVNNVPIDISTFLSTQELADAIALAISVSGLSAQPEVVSNRIVFLGLSEGASVSTTGGGVSSVGYARPLQDGDGFSLTTGDLDAGGSKVEFQYVPTSSVVTPGALAYFDLNEDGNIDLTIPKDLNNDGVDDLYTLDDSNSDGVIDRVFINADGVSQVDSLGNIVPDYIFALDANLDGVLDIQIVLPALMTTAFEADFDGDLELDLRFPADVDGNQLEDLRQLLDADGDGFNESLQILLPGPGGVAYAALTIAIDANDDGEVDRPLFYPARSEVAYEADFNFDGVLDVRFPRDLNGDGIEDVRTLVYADGSTAIGGDGLTNRVPIAIQIETDRVLTYPLDPTTNLPILSEGPLADVTIDVDANQDGTPDASVVLIDGIELTDSNEKIAELTVAAITAQTVFGLTPSAIDGGLISIGGEAGLVLDIISGSPLQASGQPGVTTNSTLTIAGPLVLSVQPAGGVSIPDGATFAITNNGQTVVFEFDINVPTQLNNPNSIGISYTLADSANVIAAKIQAAIAGSGLGITSRTGLSGSVELDGVDESQLTIPSSTPLTSRRGTVSDGETLTISNGVQTVTFEFERSVGGGGVAAGNQAVIFSSTGTSDDVAVSLAAAIQNSILAIGTTVNGSQVTLNGATSQTTIDVSNTNSVEVSGTPGGAVPISIVRSGTVSDIEVRDAIIAAVNNNVPSLSASVRGDNTIFLEGATTVDSTIPNYFLRAVADNVGNPLKSNQLDDTVTFTILLDGAQFDYGDAPDPVEDVPGRYPTSRDFDGARHLLVPDGPRLGELIDADADGQPQRNADGDDSSLVVLTDDAAHPTEPRLFTITAENPAGPTIKVSTADAEIPASFEGRLLIIDNGLERITFEVDSDGMFDEDHIRIAFDPDGEFGDKTTPVALAANLVDAIRRSGLQLAGRTLSGAQVTLIADDEDGVTFGTATSPTTVLQVGQNTVMTVEVTGEGLLDGWIDFNRDGDWDDPGERIFVNKPISSTTQFEISVPSTFAIPATPEGVTTMARFRLSTAGVSSPTGLALDGEVEDYEVRIVNGGTTANADAGGSFSVREDELLNLDASQGVLANDVARPASVLSVYSEDVGTRTLENGTLELRADGSFTYTPNADFFGTETFTYRAVDQTLLDATGALLVSAPSTVTINVTSVNDAPRGGVTQQTLSTNEDFALTVSIESLLQNQTATTTDDFTTGPANESEQTLSIELTGGGATTQGGTVRIQGGNLIYTPQTDFSGTDTFVYRVVDNGVPSQGVNVTVTVNVGEANDPPVLRNHFVTTNEDVAFDSDNSTTLTGGLLTGAVDPDGDSNALVVSSTGTIATAGGGSVQVFGDGQFIYTPSPNYAGTDQFTYTVRDADGSTNTADVTITVVGQPDAPVTVSTAPVGVSLIEDGAAGFVDLDDYFTDPDLPYGDFLTYEVESVVVPDVGGAQVNANVTGPLLTITPQANASGTAVITVRAKDSTGRLSNRLTINVNVSSRNDPPQVIGTLEDLVVPEDAQITPINMANIFRDPDGDTLNYVVTSSDTGLVTAVYNAATNQLEMSLVANASGQATITVEVGDGSGFSVSEQFLITVNAVEDIPAAVNDFYPNATSTGEILQGGIYRVTDPAKGLLANDFDGDGDAFTITSYTQPVNNTGTVVVDATTGGFVYTNTGGTLGTVDSFQYTITDSKGNSNTATVFLEIGNPLLSHQNPNNSLDVNADGVVSPIDALLIINLLNRSSGTSVSVLGLGAPPAYYDVSGDAYVTALDALKVINALNTQSSTPQAAGESPDAIGLATSSIVAGRGAVNVPQLVNPKPAIQDDTTAEDSIESLDASGVVDHAEIVDGLQNDPMDLVLDAIAASGTEDQEQEAAEIFDAAIDQLLGDFRLND
ncbi:tandem-95 repeat protein [Rosistilla carotiformis]|nr:tandem-95 repeat protein [Rosistilla carotiformis]